ncbi:hypothetical protein [Streptomyces solicathayae]|uniref:DNA polymerase III subunit epsilon n=1 Tax=Streptomyces solicathayae TaxID=3081768 RepID=A0ABZ0LMH2_9ACTN|nr:hypothetical protein [Streptomyces sp. HUAS YS2]WOX20695.1 hypothetical protein R2D22_04525 [Streptomyces sp. HUAS YS2]
MDRTNDYPAPCAACGETVPAGAGVLVGLRPKGWVVYHPEHVREPGPPPRHDHPGWHRKALTAFDIAATGHRCSVDRILAAAVRGSDGTARDWLIDPGPGPLSVDPGKRHGITVERARAEGVPAARALEELAELLAGRLAAGEPLVVWYAPYVLTMLEAELTRHGLRTLGERAPHGVAPVCDPLVLDRHADPYRSGGRSLQTVTAWYGVPHERPGDAASDAAATLALAQVLGACYPALARFSRPALHNEQLLWNAAAHGRHEPEPWPVAPFAPLPWQAHEIG